MANHFWLPATERFAEKPSQKSQAPTRVRTLSDSFWYFDNGERLSAEPRTEMTLPHWVAVALQDAGRVVLI